MRDFLARWIWLSKALNLSEMRALFIEFRIGISGNLVIDSWSQNWINDIIFKLCIKNWSQKDDSLKLLDFFQKSRVFCCYESTHGWYASTHPSCIKQHVPIHASMCRYILLLQHITESHKLHESTHNTYVSTHTKFFLFLKAKNTLFSKIAHNTLCNRLHYGRNRLYKKTKNEKF